MELKKGQRLALEYLAQHRYDWRSPTEIGEECGKDWSGASSWGSTQARALVNLGLAERSDGASARKGHYRITEEGLNVASTTEKT